MDRQNPPSKPELKLVINTPSVTGTGTGTGAGVGASSHPSSQQRPHQPDTYAQVLTDDCVDCLSDEPLSQFMRSVINEPPVWKVLVTQVTEGGQPAGLRIVKLRQIAADILRHARVNDQEFQAVYVATFLHGIQYLLQAEISGSSVLRDVMRTLVRGPLQRLQSAHPHMANRVRLCMGWGNSDEETVFTAWLQERMTRAIAVMDLARF